MPGGYREQRFPYLPVIEGKLDHDLEGSGQGSCRRTLLEKASLNLIPASLNLPDLDPIADEPIRNYVGTAGSRVQRSGTDEPVKSQVLPSSVIPAKAGHEVKLCAHPVFSIGSGLPPSRE